MNLNGMNSEYQLSFHWQYVRNSVDPFFALAII